jgi:hypothetical protein
MFKDPFSAGPAPSVHPTLTTVEENELRQHGLDPSNVRIIDAFYTEGIERTLVEALLTKGWIADVRHLPIWNTAGLVSRSRALLDQLHGGGLSSTTGPIAQCIAIEVHYRDRATFEPAAVQIIECDGEGRVKRIEDELREYQEQLPDHVAGFPFAEEPGSPNEIGRDSDRDMRNAARYHKTPYLKLGEWKALFAHEKEHLNVVKGSGNAHSLCSFPPSTASPANGLNSAVLDLLPPIAMELPEKDASSAHKATLQHKILLQPILQRIVHYRALFSIWLHFRSCSENDRNLRVFCRGDHSDIFPAPYFTSEEHQVIHSRTQKLAPTPDIKRPANAPTQYKVLDEKATAPAVHCVRLDFHQLSTILSKRGLIHQEDGGSWRLCVALFDAPNGRNRLGSEAQSTGLFKIPLATDRKPPSGDHK